MPRRHARPNLHAVHRAATAARRVTAAQQRLGRITGIERDTTPRTPTIVAAWDEAPLPEPCGMPTPVLYWWRTRDGEALP